MDIVERLNAVVEEGADPNLIYEAAEEIERLRQICTNAHDQLLRGADDNELLALLASGWEQRAGE